MKQQLLYGDLNRYRHRLSLYGMSLTRNREETEDLVQDTFYRAMYHIDKFSKGTNMQAWLFTIMRNLFINNYRKKKKHRNMLEMAKGATESNPGSHSSQNDAPCIFLAEELSTALNSVNENLTEPFLLHYNGFQYEEIAEKLDLPLGTVKSRIFFARKKLQSQLYKMGISPFSNS